MNIENELKHVIQRKPLPRLKEFRKRDKHFLAENAFLQPFFAKMLMVDEKDMGWQVAYPVVQEIFNFLSTKIESTLYALSDEWSETINTFLTAWMFDLLKVIINREISQNKKMEMVETTLWTMILLHNHFCIYKNNSFERIDFFASIANVFNMLIEISANEGEEKKLKIEMLLKLYKKFMLSNQEVAREEVDKRMHRFHVVAAKFHFFNKSILKAKKHMMICHQLMNLSHDKALFLSTDVISVCNKLVQNYYRENNFREALFWIQLGMEIIEISEVSLVKVPDKGSVFSLYDGFSDDSRKALASDKKFFEVAREQAQKKLREQYRKLLADLMSSVDNKFHIEVNDEGKSVIKLTIGMDYIDRLASNFVKCQIVCSADKQAFTVIIYDLFDVKFALFERIIRGWLFDVDIEMRMHEARKKLDEAEIIHDMPVAYKATPLMVEDVKATNKDVKKSKEEKEEKVPAEGSVAAGDSKRIDWGGDYPVYSTDSEQVFKLYGLTAHNQYLFINHSFFSRLNTEDPAAARNLVSICERGKVINDSQGAKGIIFLDGEHVKVKDASKPYRFFGSVVATTRHKEKTCQLIEVRSWERDHH